MNTSSPSPLIIIGSGLAGINLAKNWRKHDLTSPLLLVTQDDGCFYSKPMLSTALAKGASPEDLIQATPDTLRDTLNCEMLVNASVTQINASSRSITIGSDNEIHYHKLVLAVGASPMQPTFLGNAAHKVLSINSRLDYQRFYDHLRHAKTVAIIGGGLIGCELANDLSYTNKGITLLNASSSLLSTLMPAQASQQLADRLHASNVNIRPNATVTKIDHAHTSSTFTVTLADGSSLDADLVVSAIGLTPNIDLATSAGLKTSHGIETNKYLETSDQHIFALGDCARVCGHTLLYVMPLMNGAKALAKSLAGSRTAVSYPSMPVAIKTTRWPMTVLPPPKGSQHQWKLIHSTTEGEEWHCVLEEQIIGFTLSGDQINKKNTLAKRCPVLPM